MEFVTDGFWSSSGSIWQCSFFGRLLVRRFLLITRNWLDVLLCCCFRAWFFAMGWVSLAVLPLLADFSRAVSHIWTYGWTRRTLFSHWFVRDRFLIWRIYGTRKRSPMMIPSMNFKHILIWSGTAGWWASRLVWSIWSFLLILLCENMQIECSNNRRYPMYNARQGTFRTGLVILLFNCGDGVRLLLESDTEEFLFCFCLTSSCFNSPPAFSLDWWVFEYVFCGVLTTDDNFFSVFLGLAVLEISERESSFASRRLVLLWCFSFALWVSLYWEYPWSEVFSFCREFAFSKVEGFPPCLSNNQNVWVQ